MCGVAGIFRRDGEPIDPRVLKRMSDALVHRGPDGEGFHLEAGRPSVGLASRRLAVIDIPGGAGKSPVGPNYVLPMQNTAPDAGDAASETRYRILDYCGDVHLYPPET